MIKNISIKREKFDENVLLDYLRLTPLANKVEIENYTNKVFKYATIFVARLNENIIGINIVYFNDYENWVKATDWQ